jgi:hypothetical protein
MLRWWGEAPGWPRQVRQAVGLSKSIVASAEKLPSRGPAFAIRAR